MSEENEINEDAAAAAAASGGEPVLTDDEKDALLDGVSSGAVEVHSGTGSRYASVEPFVIGPRARVVSNSFPRLDSMNDQFAKTLADDCSSLLQTEVEIVKGAIRQQPFADFCDLWPARCVAAVVNAAPLPGTPLVVIDSIVIGPLVEAFFGGNSPESVANIDAVHSPGALSIANRFTDAAIGALRNAWLPLTEIAPERADSKLGLDLVESIGPSDSVIVSEFEIALGAEQPQRGSFAIVWPLASVAKLKGALEGKPRDRDAAEDARWEKALRARVSDVIVDLSSNVGNATMTLGELINLAPGDVIGIDTPRVATLIAQGVPLIEGRFGIQAGRNAIEAVSWLEPDINN